MIPGFWPALVVAIIIAAAVVATTGRRQSKGRAATRPMQDHKTLHAHFIETDERCQEEDRDVRTR